MVIQTKIEGDTEIFWVKPFDSSISELVEIRDWIIENPPKFNIWDCVVFEDTVSNNSFYRWIFYDIVKKLPTPVDWVWKYSFWENHLMIDENSIIRVPDRIISIK